MDALVAAAEVEMDDARREELLRQASLAALDDAMVVPLYLQNALWAIRADLTYEARMDERNDPVAVRPAAR
jgi:peptide/nickel transport system substrate-binding protein